MVHYVDLDYDKIVTQLLMTHRYFFLIEAGFFLPCKFLYMSKAAWIRCFFFSFWNLKFDLEI